MEAVCRAFTHAASYTRVYTCWLIYWDRGKDRTVCGDGFAAAIVGDVLDGTRRCRLFALMIG